MLKESFCADDLTGAVRMAHNLAARAVPELRTAAEDCEASAAMARALASIDAAGTAIEAGDPARADLDFRDAIAALGVARAEAKAAAAGATYDVLDVVLDLIDQAARAVDGAWHRMRNADTCHTVYGAIRTPRAERLP